MIFRLKQFIVSSVSRMLMRRFCVSGVLLRKLEAGIRGISHVIVDEIHERDINVSLFYEVQIYIYSAGRVTIPLSSLCVCADGLLDGGPQRRGPGLPRGPRHPHVSHHRHHHVQRILLQQPHHRGVRTHLPCSRYLQLTSVYGR